ncbi:hypothetical protein FEE19_12035, partial [Lactobacillus murinus]|nr:hypothetical protein [Ligilactobacillus murinus]NEG24619.1 hypothetical protein [Ligilactobacillus murinus]NEG29145.1 hypothetical protein [Ligilactobacillus murinus]
MCYDSGTSERFLSNYCELPFEKYERSNFFNEPFLITKKPLSMAIMPSKYTDEIENSSYTWRVFYMS